MPRPVSVVRLIELMADDARLAAQIGDLQRQRSEARATVVAELQRRKVTEVAALGKVVELRQQERRRPSVAAAKERLAARPEILSRLLVEVVDNKELEQLRKDRLLEDADVDFIAPKAPHGDPYPALKVQGRRRAKPAA